MSWQYTDPRLASRAHHIEDLRKEAAVYRLTRDLISIRRQQRWVNVRGLVARVWLVTGFRRRRWPTAPGGSQAPKPFEPVIAVTEGPHC